jgi:Reverse transcriptase (RNA-dependent DNA polymerase)
MRKLTILLAFKFPGIQIKRRCCDTDRFKARWVIRGFLQEYGIDYEETFAAVARTKQIHRQLNSCCHLISLDLCVHLFDIKAASVYENIDGETYMPSPKGCGRLGCVCRLLKSLYVLSPEANTTHLGSKTPQKHFYRWVSSHLKPNATYSRSYIFLWQGKSPSLPVPHSLREPRNIYAKRARPNTMCGRYEFAR